jgi:hypothetical protein
MVHLRNCNHTSCIVVRTRGAPAGRLIPPGATTAMAIDLVILADPRIQRRLAQARVAVLDQAGWCTDLRQRRRARLVRADRRCGTGGVGSATAATRTPRSQTAPHQKRANSNSSITCPPAPQTSVAARAVELGAKAIGLPRLKASSDYS